MPWRKSLFLYAGIFVLVFVSQWFLSTSAHAATKYWVGGSGDNANGSANDWSMSDPASCADGLGDASTVPGASDIAVFDADCDNNATINSAWSVSGVNIASGYAGTLTQSGSNAFTVGVDSYTQAGGTFAGGSGTITITKDFILSGGGFTATSGVMSMSPTPAADSFTISGGTFNHNNGTVQMAGAGDTDLDVATSVTFNNLTFNKTGSPSFDNLSIAASDTVVVLGTFAFTDGELTGTGTLNVQGGLTNTTASDGGSVIMSITGGATRTISLVAGQFPAIVLNAANTTINGASSGTISLENGLTIQNGTFTGAAGDIFINGSFVQSGGTFTAPSGTLTIQTEQSSLSSNFTLSGGTFAHNSGTVVFSGARNTIVDVATSVTFNNLTINKTGTPTYDGINIASGDTFIVLGTLTFTQGEVSGGTYQAQGNVVVGTGTSDQGNAALTFSGAAAQTFTDGGGTKTNGTITVNKTVGSTVTLATATSFNASGQDVTVTSGMLDLAGFAFTVNDQFTIGSSGSLQLHGDETITGGPDSLATGSTVIYTGSGTYSSFLLGNTYHSLTFNGTGSWTMPAALDVNGNLTLTTGTLDVSASNYAITVAGNWTNNGGTFIRRAGTVTFDGSGTQTLAGGGTATGKPFYNLIYSGSGTLQPATSDFKVDNNFTLNSGAGTFDNATNDRAITVGGDVMFANSALSMGDATWTVSGNWDANSIAVVNADNSTLVMNGVNKTIAHKGGGIHEFGDRLKNVTISGTITADSAGVVGDGLTVSGTFTVNSNIATSFYSTAAVTSTGTITGTADYLRIREGFTQQDGVVSVTTILLDQVGLVPIAAGTYDSNMHFIRTGTETINVNGTVVFNKNVVFEQTGTAPTDITTVNMNNNNVTFKGNVTVVSIPGGSVVWNKGTGTVTLGDNASNGTQTIDFNGKTVEDIVINGTGDTKQFTGNVTTDSFTGTAGTIDFNGKSVTSTGAFSLGTATQVVPTGLAGSTIVVGGNFTATGEANEALTLNASSAWTLTVTGTATASYVTVAYSNAGGGSTVTCTACTNSGNNTNWIFPVVGTVYTDEGVTNIGAGKTIAISLNGAAATTAVTDSSGAYVVNVGSVTTGDIVTAYIDNATEKAVTISVGGSAGVASMNLYQNRLIVKNDNSSSTTNANLATADNNGDSDIAALYTMSGSDITVPAGKELFIWSGSTYAPGGTVTADDLDINGTFTMGSNNVTLSGTWDATGGTFTASTGQTVTLSSTSTETITSNPNTFKNLTISGNGGHYNSQDTMRVSGALTIATGATLDTNGSNFINTSGTFSNDGTLRIQGSEVFTGFTNDTNSGTTLYDGTGTYSSLAGLTNFYHLTLSGTGGTWTQAAAIDANGTLTLTAGTLDASASNYGATVAGGWTDTGTGAYNERSGTVTFDATETINSNEPFYGVTINASGGTVSLGAALDVNGALTISAGTLDVTASNFGISVAGNFAHTGGSFTGRSGTVTFDGTSQTISGDTTFYNFTKVEGSDNATDETLTFAAGSTQTVSNTLTIDGRDEDDRINLVSGTPGTQWRVNPQSTRAIDFIEVTDSNNTNASVILCTNDCLNGGGNTNWAFPMTVTIYSNEGTSLIGANKTVSLSVNGGAKETADTNSSSIAIFTSLAASSGDVVAIWLDDETENGMIVTITNGTTLAFNLYQNRLILQHEAGSQITNTHLTTAAGTGDNDVAGLYTVDSGNLTVADGIELLINSGDVFKPGGTVTAHDLDINGTFTMEGNNVTLSGTWDATGGTFTSTGSQNVTFNSTAAETITSNGNCFNNITYSIGEGGSISNTDTLCVNGTQTVSSSGGGEGGEADTSSPTISDLSVVAGETTATISWKTSESADSAVDYGTSTDLGTSESDNSDTVWHAINLSGLTANTTYYYKVTSQDSSNNSVSSDVNTFATAESGTGSSSDTTPPTISNLAVSGITSSGAQVSWSTGESALGYINFGTTTAYDHGATPGNNTAGTSKEVTLTGLSPSTEYHYQVTAIDPAGNIGVSPDETLTTSAAEETIEATEVFQESESTSGTTPLDITSEAPAVVDITGSSVTVQWKTDKSATSIVYYREKGSTADPKQVGTVASATEHSVKLEGLLDSTAYEYSVESVADDGSKVRSKKYEFTTTLPKLSDVTVQDITDTCASFIYVTETPTSSNIELTNLSSGETLSIQKDDITSQHKVPLCELDPNTEYQATVVVKGPSGSTTKSIAYVFNTRPDTADPILTQIETRSALAEGGDDAVQTIVTWSTNEPATTQVIYNEGLTRGSEFKLKTDLNKDDFVTKHVAVLPNLKPSTVYEFYVVSADRATHEVRSQARVLLTPARRVSALDLIISNLEETFGWINAIKYK